MRDTLILAQSFGVFLPLAFLLVAIESRARSRQRGTFYQHLAAIVARNLPLADGVEALSRDILPTIACRVFGSLSALLDISLGWIGLDRDGGLRRTVARGTASSRDRIPRALAQAAVSMTQGRSLAEALRTEGRVFPSDAVDRIAAGEASGALAPVLRDLADEETRRAPGGMRIYLAQAYVALILTPTVFLGVFVWPQIVRTMRDVTEPASLFLKDGTAHSGAPFWTDLGTTLLSTVIPAVFLLMWVGLLVQVLAHWIAPVANLLSALRRWICAVPPLRTLGRAQAGLRVARALRPLLAMGVPLPEALAIPARASRDRYWRDGFQAAADQVTAGHSLSEAGAKAGFPPNVVGFLALGEQGHGIVDALGALQRSSQARADREIAWMERVAFPAVILALGCLVGLMSLSMFGTLVELTETLL